MFQLNRRPCIGGSGLRHSEHRTRVLDPSQQWGGRSWGDAGYMNLPIKADDDVTGGTCVILDRANGQPPLFPSK